MRGIDLRGSVGKLMGNHRLCPEILESVADFHFPLFTAAAPP